MKQLQSNIYPFHNLHLDTWTCFLNFVLIFPYWFSYLSETECCQNGLDTEGFDFVLQVDQ
jgi:hypothetical protein